MPPRKKSVKRKASMKRKSPSKPIGFVKEGKRFRLVFGSKTKPRRGSKSFNTRKAVIAAGVKRLVKKRK